VAAKVSEHAQGLKLTDPEQSVALYEEVIRLLCTQVKQRNKKIRALKKILLDTLPEGEGEPPIRLSYWEICSIS